MVSWSTDNRLDDSISLNKSTEGTRIFALDSTNPISSLVGLSMSIQMTPCGNSAGVVLPLTSVSSPNSLIMAAAVLQVQEYQYKSAFSGSTGHVNRCTSRSDCRRPHHRLHAPAIAGRQRLGNLAKKSQITTGESKSSPSSGMACPPFCTEYKTTTGIPSFT